MTPHALDELTVLFSPSYRARQKVILQKKIDIAAVVVNFSPSIPSLHRRIQATYPGNLIAIFSCIQQLKPFELKCVFFQSELAIKLRF